MKKKESQNNKNKDGIRLRNLRDAMGMTIRDLAKEFRVGFSSISHWENGTYPVPGPISKLMDIYEEKREKKK